MCHFTSFCIRCAILCHLWHMTYDLKCHYIWQYMGIIRSILISTIDLRYPKSWSKNIFWKKIKNSKIPIFPLYFWVYSLVNVKVQFWEGRWPRIKKFIKQKLLSTIFYRRKHLSQIGIWFFIFLTIPNRQLNQVRSMADTRNKKNPHWN